MVPMRKVLLLLSALILPAAPGAWAAQPKIDKESCDQLKTEQARFMESGIVADLQKGPEWGKANLTAERLREIEHFILLDEQLKFGCRQVTLTGDILRAGEAASRIEANPNPPSDDAAQGAGGADTSDGPATPPGQIVREKPAGKHQKQKSETGASGKPKAADAYQPPAHPGRHADPDAPSAQRAAGSQ